MTESYALIIFDKYILTFAKRILADRTVNDYIQNGKQTLNEVSKVKPLMNIFVPTSKFVLMFVDRILFL